MPSLVEIKQKFWSYVWQCTHKHPCQRCCWPWIGVRGPVIYDDPAVCARNSHKHPIFFEPQEQRGIGVHVCAYAFSIGGDTFPFRGKSFAICHSCDYGACCNYSHIALGAAMDNYRDRRGKDQSTRYDGFVYFPDGRRIYPDRLRHECLLGLPITGMVRARGCGGW